MKKIALFLLLIFTKVNAQENNYSLTQVVTRQDIEQKIYSKDSTANALVIYEKGYSYVDKSSFRLNTKISKKLKVFNKNGFKHAEITLPIYDNKKGKKEKIKDINATIYNIENGKVIKTKLKNSDIIEEKYNDNYTLIKFAFPNVKEGSVINYSYTIDSPFMYKYKSWNFQDEIPKLYSEYNASIPGNWEYNTKLVGGKKLFHNKSKLEKKCLESGSANANCVISTYIMKDIPAFINEDYMTSRDNYLARIEYELKTFRGFDGRVEHITKSWKTVDNEIKKDTDLGRELQKQSRVKGIFSNEITQYNNPLDKAKAILKYVQKNYSWNEKFNLFENISVKNLLNEKSGSVGDINTLLYLLLKEYNIDVKPIILSTRSNGFITQIYPVLTDFNYLIVKADIDGKTYLLDATEDYLYFGQIPFRCLNQYGRELNFNSIGSLYNIEIKDMSLQTYSYELNLNSNNVIKGNVNYKSNGYHSLDSRKAYFRNPNSYTEAYENEYNSIRFSDFNVTNTQQTDDDFIINFNIETTTDSVGNNIYLNPFLFKFFDENPFKLQERSYPIDFGFKDAYIYSIKINIDETYKISEIPKSLSLKLPQNKGSLLFSTQQAGNTVSMYFKLSFNETIYDSAYYEGLKTIMDRVVDILNNTLIVLEKKD